MKSSECFELGMHIEMMRCSSAIIFTLMHTGPTEKRRLLDQYNRLVDGYEYLKEYEFDNGKLSRVKGIIVDFGDVVEKFHLPVPLKQPYGMTTVLDTASEQSLKEYQDKVRSLLNELASHLDAFRKVVAASCA
jgi:hypothetical protein